MGMSTIQFIDIILCMIWDSACIIGVIGARTAWFALKALTCFWILMTSIYTLRESLRALLEQAGTETLRQLPHALGAACVSIIKFGFLFSTMPSGDVLEPQHIVEAANQPGATLHQTHNSTTNGHTGGGTPPFRAEIWTLFGELCNQSVPIIASFLISRISSLRRR